MEQLDYRFCGLVEEYRLEIAKKSGIDLQLDVSLPGCTICGIHETILISRKFGFIGWLVQNDKIDRSKVLITFSMAEYDGLGNMYGHGVDDNQRLLMILAISDTPIEDLISYLR